MPHKLPRKCYNLGIQLGKLRCELSGAMRLVDEKRGPDAKEALKGVAIRASDTAFEPVLSKEHKATFTEISTAARKLAGRVGRKKRIPTKLAKEALDQIGTLRDTAYMTTPKDCL